MSEKEKVFEEGAIEIGGARVHNLKNISVSIPRHKLIVVTGLSGSGKSSLVFDVLLAEGQRRYIETFSAYARGFLSSNERPDVDYINGLSPVVAIEQKTASGNPRSTVGTITEIYDYLRLLFARVATPYSYLTGKAMIRYNETQIIELIIKDYEGKGIEILAPVVKNRKGHYRELLESLRKKGFLHVYADGKILQLSPGLILDRYSNHYVAVVIDKFEVKEGASKRIGDAVKLALSQGDGLVDIRKRDDGTLRHLSSKLMDPESGLAYVEPTLATFSFNSPRGWCPHCRGTGTVEALDRSKLIVNPSLSLKEGAIPLLKKKELSTFFRDVKEFLRQQQLSIDSPAKDIPDKLLNTIILGDNSFTTSEPRFTGLAEHITLLGDISGFEIEPNSALSEYMHREVCTECSGARLSKEALSFRIGEYNIGVLAHLELSELQRILPELRKSISEGLQEVAEEIFKEIEVRTSFLLDIGLNYLSLDRAACSLSGGEAQRIRLATQIGTGLVEVLYLLDEPGIGLHARDNERLLTSLKKLRDAGNSIVVVEHDRTTMLSADYIIDLGPGAGRLGGNIVFCGTPTEIRHAHTITADYLNGIKKIPIPQERRQGNGKKIRLTGASGNNLKNVTLTLPLGTFTCITGVSGSGKSTIINETLVPALAKILYRSKTAPLSFQKLSGEREIDKLAVVDQSPIGRTPRSNPATYTGVFTEIRKIFVALPESKARGYKPGRFSFNVSGGRCEACKGNGYRTISMRFLPDVTVPCEVCLGRRYSRETLEVRFKGKSISDVLDMTINQAAEFFENVPKIKSKLEVMRRVGLGYIKLGQPSTTLSGGEAQRIKLSEELAKRDTGKTLYILDEPTTGLHFEDIRLLLGIVTQLVEKGNTVVIIEHDLDVIKCADHIIELGPEGGDAGGEILFEGTPEEMAEKCTRGATAPFIKGILEGRL